MKQFILNIVCTILPAIILFACEKSDADHQTPIIDTAENVVFDPDTIFNVNSGTILNELFWEEVQYALGRGDVLVRFSAGEYTLSQPIVIKNVGHSEHLLRISAQALNRTIIQGDIPTLMLIENTQNIQLYGFTLTGSPTEHGLEIRNCRNVKAEYCHFQDMPNISVASLGIYESTTNSNVINCRFERVGATDKTHMIYVDNQVSRVNVIGNYFKDCSGSFVYYGGNTTDYGMHYKNDFISTGNYLHGTNPVFIEISADNSINPGNQYILSNYVFVDNTFSYGNMGSQENLWAVVFHNSGFSPVDRNYDLSKADANTLDSGTIVEKQTIMSTQLGLTSEKIYFSGNVNRNVSHNVLYRYTNMHGSTNSWEGTADIENALNSETPVKSKDEALTFYNQEG